MRHGIGQFAASGTGATSAQDATWGMDMDAGEASAMVLSQGALYTTGDFAAVRERFAATTLPREGAAAIAAAGGVDGLAAHD